MVESAVGLVPGGLGQVVSPGQQRATPFLGGLKPESRRRPGRGRAAGTFLDLTG